MIRPAPDVALPPDRYLDLALPTVVATSVIRSSHQGESHGGVFLVDLATGGFELIIDWNDGSIDWSGRGGDRGLRGIAFHDDRVLLAASDEIFVYDNIFRPITSIRSRYLRHCHEMTVHGDRLYLTSTGFDSVLVFDLQRSRFVDGICLRALRLSPARLAYHALLKRLRGRFAGRWPALARTHLHDLQPRRFDPEQPGGPEPADLFHLNNVDVGPDGLLVSGTRLDGLFRLADHGIERVAPVPAGTHNARIASGMLVYNDTEAGRVVAIERDGRLSDFALPVYRTERLENGDIGRDHARVAFGRGLCVLGPGVLAAGSSPATISVFRRGSTAPLTSVNLTMDVRNAIHGLEVWPFDRRLEDWRSRRRASILERPRQFAAPLTLS